VSHSNHLIISFQFRVVKMDPKYFFASVFLCFMLNHMGSVGGAMVELR
jgi:hypothetical protein